MHVLLKHPLVDSDVEEAAFWYHERDPAVALRFVDETRLGMRTAAESPLRFAVRFEDVRRVRLRRFPHSVFFTLRDDIVLVLGVLHGARDLPRALSARHAELIR